MNVKVLDEDAKDYTIDALKTELDSALLKIAVTLVGGRDPATTAWWLCANHARFIIDHPNLNVETKLIEMATEAGPPPTTNKDWPAWFERVRKIRPHHILRR